MKKLFILLGLFLLPGCFFISIPLPMGSSPLEEKVIGGSGKSKILLLDISGIISEQPKKGLLTEESSMVSRIKQELDKAAGDKEVKAVILKINSPGGTVTASDIIYREIKEFKHRTGKKVVASLMDIATSGGYYIAVSADKIIAHPTNITGSIGVLILKLNFKGLLEKIGVVDETIKSGDRKDILSPFKTFTLDDKQIMEKIVQDFFIRFTSIVEKERNLTNENDLIKIKDGRPVSASEALTLNLIDQVGYIDNAIDLAKKETGLKEAKIIIYGNPASYQDNIYSRSMDSKLNYANLINVDLESFVQGTTPRFMYLWIPY